LLKLFGAFVSGAVKFFSFHIFNFLFIVFRSLRIPFLSVRMAGPGRYLHYPGQTPIIKIKTLFRKTKYFSIFILNIWVFICSRFNRMGMNGLFTSPPGYRVYDYLLVITPPEVLWNRLMKIKEDFSIAYKALYYPCGFFATGHVGRAHY
jgi:hypothetical protein